MANVLPLRRLPQRHTAEQCQDDKRAAQGPQEQLARLLHFRLACWPHLLRGTRQAKRVQDAALRTLLLPRCCAGTQDFRPARLEYHVRLQSERPAHICQTATPLRRKVLQQDTLQGPALYGRGVQLRRKGHRRPRPPHSPRPPQGLLQRAAPLRQLLLQQQPRLPRKTIIFTKR